VHRSVRAVDGEVRDALGVETHVGLSRQLVKPFSNRDAQGMHKGLEFWWGANLSPMPDL
jgi:hypothetical protein